LIFPPVIGGKVKKAFIGPASDLIYIICFSGTGGTSDNELKEFEAVWKRYPSDSLGVFNGL